MNSIIKSAAKVIEKLIQLNGKSDAKQDEIQYTRERFGEVLKKKWKNKTMHGQNKRNMDMEQRLAIKFCFKTGKSTTETLQMVNAAYGDKALSRSNVFPMVWTIS